MMATFTTTFGELFGTQPERVVTFFLASLANRLVFNRPLHALARASALRAQPRTAFTMPVRHAAVVLRGCVPMQTFAHAAIPVQNQLNDLKTRAAVVEANDACAPAQQLRCCQLLYE